MDVVGWLNVEIFRKFYDKFMDIEVGFFGIELLYVIDV